MNFSRGNENLIPTERMTNTDTPKPHLVVQEDPPSEDPSATFRSTKKAAVKWLVRILGTGALAGIGTGANQVYKHEIALNSIVQTVADLRETLQEMKNDQKENNRLLIEFLRDRRGP